MTSAQKDLADYMSELSEEGWRAGWMDGLEFALWEAVLGQRHEYGYLTIAPDHRTRLRVLSERCAGWIVYLDNVGETWVPLDDWKTRFSAARPPFAPEVDDG
jgi:hypothetical protein